jgi:hypothetical protein
MYDLRTHPVVVESIDGGLHQLGVGFEDARNPCACIEHYQLST